MDFSENDIDILARTLYGEARGEFFKYGIGALIAVANVVLNRCRRGFARKASDVCLEPYQFSCWRENDVNYQVIKNIKPDNRIFQKCLEVSRKVLSEDWPDITAGCDHYHAKSVRPYWAAHMEPKIVFGNHCFYQLKGDIKCQ